MKIAAGCAYRSIDNLGRIDETQYDAAGRTVRTIQNYANGAVAETDTDCDVTVDYAYSAGRLVTMTAYNAKGDDSDPNNENVEAQATKYLYESDVNASWQTAAVYPDSTDVLSQNATTKVWTITTDNGDHVSTDYDRLGRVAATMDQRAVEHEYVFDSAGRLSADTVTSLGSSGIVDDAILRIGTTYDDLGRVETVTSYSDIYGTTVVNQVEYVYNGWGQVAREYQEHDGPVDGNTLFVQYDYADGASGGVAKYVRLDQVTYPNGRAVHYDYGATGAIDDIMSRLATIGDGTNTHASYRYLGAGRIVTEDYEEIDVKVDYSANNFAALDRFGRVVDQLWNDYGADPDVTLDEYTYGYDLAGNRVWKENVVSGSLGTPVHMDELYAYDAIDRLTSAERGNLVDGQNGKEIEGTPNFTQDWGLDVLGNWFEFDDDGTSQTRTVNAANEITAVDSSADDVAHDAAGNMIRAAKLDGSGEHFHLSYDAWNRLVAVYDDNGSTLVAKYDYDGANRRIVKGVDEDSDGSLDTFTHFLHQGNQVIETREGDDVSGEAPAAESLEPKHQHLWSPRYIDSLILRDEYDAQGQIITANRLHYLSDANYNVTALLDATGDVVERYLYASYGVATILDDDFSADDNGLSDYSNTTLYTGRELDLATGFYYYRARYYHGDLGRFITRDPIGYRGSKGNLYAYVMASPLTYRDPSGSTLCKCECHHAVAGGYGGGVGWETTKWEFIKGPATGCKQACDSHDSIGTNSSCNCEPTAPTTDEAAVVALCGGNPTCEQSILNILTTVETAPIGDPPPGHSGKCFGYINECKKDCPGDKPLPGGVTVDYVVVEPYDYWIEDTFWLGPVKPTCYNVFGGVVCGYTQHAIGRVCVVQNDGSTKCMYFDVGSQSNMGQFGGDDHWFPPDDADYIHDIDPNRTTPYPK